MTNEPFDEQAGTAPIERILLTLARHDGDVEGKAVCFKDQSEFHFSGLAELVQWLKKDRLTLSDDIHEAQKRTS